MALVLAVLVFVCSACVTAQVVGSSGGIVAPNNDHKHLKGCLLPKTDELMSFNETRSLPDLCLLISCREDRIIDYKHCVSILVPQDCTLTDYNTTLPYPECCPVMVCENSTALNETVENPTTPNILDENTTNTTTLNQSTTYSTIITKTEFNQSAGDRTNTSTTKNLTAETISKALFNKL